MQPSKRFTDQDNTSHLLNDLMLRNIHPDDTNTDEVGKYE